MVYLQVNSFQHTSHEHSTYYNVTEIFFYLLTASLLLDSLIQSLTTKERSNCKAVYLHVLATNHIAIRFYERRRFKAHSFLPYYYSIQGKPRDAYLYVLYVNGGKAPWSFLYPFYIQIFFYVYMYLKHILLPYKTRQMDKTSCKLMKSSPVHINTGKDNFLQIQII